VFCTEGQELSTCQRQEGRVRDEQEGNRRGRRGDITQCLYHPSRSAAMAVLSPTIAALHH